jgi:bifunctional UDP-N-acetylglucosamine pyrophosphorylase/glucosamine-1-phosphate N-acetyltransferase
VSEPVVVILAAGQGTRMRSATPKLLHPLCGRPMIDWPVRAARGAGARRIVVVDSPQGRLRALLADQPDVEIAVQEQADGTAGAVRAAAAYLERARPVVVLAGDVPLIRAETIAGLVEAHERDGAAATMVTAVLEDPRGYGRVLRAPDGTVERVVETKSPGDATALELHIREVNTGIFAFDGGELLDALGQVQADNAQGEYYLPDVLPVLRAAERTVVAYELDDVAESLGINDRVALAEVRGLAQRRIHEALMRAGVTIVDPATTYLEPDLAIGADTVIHPGTAICAATSIGANCRIGPNSRIGGATIADGVTISESVVVDSQVGAHALIGPFAHLRRGNVVGAGVRIGNFVELKNAQLGEGVKAGHLSYLGDATVGPRANIGAGTITCNFDGERKNATVIGADAFIGSDTALVAPITVGEGAATGAGTVAIRDIPAGDKVVGNPARSIAKKPAQT